MAIFIEFPEFIPEFLHASHIAAVEAERQRIAVRLKKIAYIWIKPATIVYESASGLLWGQNIEKYSLKDGLAKSKENWASVDGWSLPIKSELVRFSQSEGNPFRSRKKYRLYGEYDWLCAEGCIDLDDGCVDNVRPDSGRLIFCSKKVSSSPKELIDLAIENAWLLPYGDEVDLLAPLRAMSLDLKKQFAPIDYLTCRQPKLEDAQFTDPNKGLWEAWGQSDEDLAEWGIRARNPAIDVRPDFIAIDFGTSSTVVARDNNGRPELMRVGVKDFWEKQQPAHYENPTVLEFIDFAAMLEEWQSTAYRPGVLWDQVRCSHEALHNWRHNESDPAVVSSILGKIKQWALRQQTDLRLRISDQQEKPLEHELAALAPRNPVKGQPLTVSEDDPFDPVELYAWFLGMNINWRGRGLFLKYFMSFPVDYPQAVKDNILAAFRRGLQRSLPETLVRQPVFNDFSVEERASEPAAYAAIALPTLDIDPGEGDGVAYAVFDFGGGTADFDYGYYRQPTSEEEDDGWEAVFERHGVAGDKFLGGENLLENLAYQTFRHNLELCREKKIAFTRPLDAENFAGSEMFLERTRAATTNTLMLTARLRPLWETGQLAGGSSGVQKMDLLTREGAKVSCEMAIPQEALRNYLAARIEQGVMNFYAGMAKAFAGQQTPEDIHVLLAGNASRSPLVSALFGLTPPDAAKAEQYAAAHDRVQTLLVDQFNGQPPRVIAHPPLPADDTDVYRPTGKTGVALGLLKLCPGGTLRVIDHARQAANNEAPFGCYVGRTRLGKFQPGLLQGTAYGEWHELGAPRERVFNLFYTQSPLARTGALKEGDNELTKVPLHLAGERPGQRVFARAIGPNRIELCTALSKDEAAQPHTRENLREMDLL